MKNRLNFNFTQLLKDQTLDFWPYYFFALIFLFLTHKIQSDLPFKARELAELVHANSAINYKSYIWFAVGIIIFRTLSRILFFYPARVLQKQLREELLLKIQLTPPIRYRHLSGGQLFQYLTGDIDQIRALIGFVGLQGGNFIIGLLVLVPKLISFNAHLIYALTPMLVAFFIFTFIVSKNKKYFKSMQEAQGDVQNVIIESFQGKKTIKNFHAEDPFIKLFSESSLKELYFFYRSSLGISITLPLIAFGVGLSMLWGAFIIKDQNLGAGTLILFSGFIFLFMEPLSYLSWIGVVISRSSASWKRLYELNDKMEVITENEKLLNNLNRDFHESNLNILFWEKPIAIKIEKLKWNILVSKTGHGKSFILENLAQVLIENKKNVSVVFQDPYIYNDSIINNIFLGNPPTESETEAAKRILKLFGLDFLESDLSKLLELEVGENGKRLSGGQSKRLCLIRSILSKADYLLWDDPFSSVDLILEKEIIQNLRNNELFKSKTIILTSHRLTTVRSSDVVTFLDKDRGIVEYGETNKLLNSKGELSEYFQKQMV
jgi:ATP-binding cassette subfamily B protein